MKTKDNILNVIKRWYSKVAGCLQIYTNVMVILDYAGYSVRARSQPSENTYKKNIKWLHLVSNTNTMHLELLDGHTPSKKYAHDALALLLKHPLR